MGRQSNTLTEKKPTGTTSIDFKVTGTGEYWSIPNTQSEDAFTKEDFEQALKKVSRKIKK